MYDLNQIPNDYTVELRNRFKGLDLKELWVEVSNIRIVCEVQPCPLEVTVIVPWGGDHSHHLGKAHDPHLLGLEDVGSVGTNSPGIPAVSPSPGVGSLIFLISLNLIC